MLHLRSTRLRGTASRIPPLRDILAASDPGLLRLQLAVRGTLSVFLSAGAAFLVAGLAGFTPMECAGGVTFSMIAPFLMREPTRLQRQKTLLALLVPAVVASVATTLLHGHGMAGDSLFLVLVFLCFLLGPRSPRGVGLGLVAVITTYVGLYLELPPTTLPVQIASQVMAVPIVALACFVLVPVDTAATLRRTVATVQARAAQVIRTARTADADSGAALRLDMLRLNDAALAADDQLALFDPNGGSAVRAKLVEVELWAARLALTLRNAPPDPRQAARMMLHARRVGRGGRYATRADQYPSGTMLAALVALGNAVHALGLAVQTRMTTPPPAAAPALRGPLAWHLAARVTLAAGLAMAGGMALSPQRWFWAVITVYVVFLNTRSRGDTIHKGVQRLGGTLLGIATGLVIATTLGGDGVWETAALLLSIFGMYYFVLVSYTAGIFCVTVMLGLLYGMLGASLETVLVLRFEETAIGAAAAMLVAALVFPSRTRAQVRRSGQAVLTQLAAVVALSRDALAGRPGASPLEAMRPVDRAVADLQLAIAPLVAGRTLLRRPRLERPVSAVLESVSWTRMLAAAAQSHAGPASPHDLVRLERIQARLEALGRGEPEPAREPPGGASTTEAGEAIMALDRAVTILADRVELGVYETFAIAP